MFVDFLKKIDFPIQPFLLELDKKQLLFFEFLLSLPNKSDISSSCNSLKDIGYFEHRVKKLVKSAYKKRIKEEVMDEYITVFSESGLIPLIYKTTYEYANFHKDVFSHPNLFAIKQFAFVFYQKSIKNLLDVVLIEPYHFESVIGEPFLKTYCFPNKPVLNSLGLLHLIGNIDYLLKEEKVNFSILEEINELRQQAIELFMEQIYEIKENEIKQGQKEVNKYQSENQKLKKDIKKKEELVEKQKEFMKKANIEIKQLKKETAQETKFKVEPMANQKDITNLHLDLQKKEEEIQQLITQQKQENQKSYLIFETTINKLNNKITELKMKNEESQTECKEWQKKWDVLQSENMEGKMIAHLSEKGFSPSFFLAIEPHYEHFKQQLLQPIQTVQKVALAPQIEIEKIGYCLIENDTHYAVFSDKSKIEILHVPDKTYIGEGQFIKVAKDGTFKWIYNYKFEESEKDYQIQGFGTVIYRGNDTYIQKDNREEIKITIPKGVQLRDNQVVSFDSRHRLLRFYRPIRHNANEFMASIKAKKHSAYFVLKVLSSGVLLRNIENGEEEFKVLIVPDNELKEQRTLCLKEGEVMTAFHSSKFYTYSTYYQKGEYGVIEKKNDVIFVKKISGEVAILNDIPTGLDVQEGQIIKVDEFNNYLYIKRDEEGSTREFKPKIIKKPIASLQKSSIIQIQIRKNILIVGNPSYENSYKMALLKNGLRAEVLDGYSSWAKVKSALKEKDMVVVTTEFVSHDNMWKLKEEHGIPVIFSEFDGANRIVEKITEYEGLQEETALSIKS